MRQILAALLVSAIVHILLFAFFFQTKEKSDQKTQISARQGFAVEILVSGNSQGVGPSMGLADPKKESTGMNLRKGAFTGTLSDLMNHIEYPELAQEMELEGIVRFETSIGSDGKVRQAKIISSSGHDILDKAAMSGILRWTFSDAENKTIQFNVRFRLTK